MGLVSQLLIVGFTILAYLFALLIFTRTGRKPFMHPIVVSVCIILIVLSYIQLPIESYLTNTSWISWLLAPATVALAVPLFGQINNIRTAGIKLLVPILVGGVVAPILAVLVLFVFKVELSIILSTLTKSITTPFAMDTSKIIGGYPALAAALVVVTGILAAVFARPIFALFKRDHIAAQGIALGTVGHAVGTAEAMRKSNKCGAFATIALCINGILTTILLPLLLKLFG